MLNWRELPFVRILAPFLLGIATVALFDLSFQNLLLISGILSLFVLLTSLLIGLEKYTFRGLILVLCVYLLALQHTYWNNELRHKHHFRTEITRTDTLIAWVADMPQLGKWARTTVRVETWNNCFDCTGNVLLYLERTPQSEALQYGDRIICSIQVLPVETPKNPNAFDYARYLHYQNIHYQAFIRAEDWAALEGERAWQLLRRIYRFRRQLLNILTVHLQDEGALAVAASLTLGYRANLSEELRTAYADTGAIHVLAVSGLHVGLIYLFIGWILQHILPETKAWGSPKAIILILSIWAFALLTGSSASVLRAATMFTFLAIGQNMRRFYNIYNTLATAAFVSLVWNPYLLFQVGFQLSYVAVLGIVYFQPKIYAWYSPRNWLSNYIWTLLSVSFAAQLAVSPIGIFYFHQFPPWFWLSSLVVIPGAFFILSISILLFLFSAFNSIASNVGIALNALIASINAIIYYIQGLPGLVKGLWLLWYEIPLIYGCIFSFDRWLMQKKAIALLLALSCLMLFLSSRSFLNMQQIQAATIVLYHVKGHSLIDFFDGKKVYSIHSKKLSKKDKNFAAQQQRWAAGIQELHEFSVEKDSLIETSHWLYDLPFIQFHDKRLAVLDSLPYTITDSLLGIDYLLLYGNPKLEIENLLQIFEVDCLLFDASTSYRRRELWRKSCEALGQCYHDTATMGAWVKLLE